MTHTFLNNEVSKRGVVSGIVAVCALALSGCGGSGPEPTSETSASSAVERPIISPVEGLEVTELTFGFIKLTDMAPLAIAYENGYF